MTPAARLQAAIDLLDEIEAALASQGAPADLILRRYFKTRRYIGAKDRAAVGGLVYDIIRARGRLLWALRQAAASVNGRHLMLAYGCAPDLFGVGGYGPAPLTAEESLLRSDLGALATPPPAALANLPEHIYNNLANRFGDNIKIELEALAGRAPLDLRVNTLRMARDEAQALLAARGVIAAPCRYSPWGLRIDGQAAINNEPLYRDGNVEIQDEAAQVAVLLAGAAPDMTVIDLCAGAGGKTLALFAAMAGDGQVAAADIDHGRLKELERRARRAGIEHMPVHLLPASGEARGAALAALGQNADLVFLDVPCSGSGTWRRSPDLRWRHDAAAIADLAARQAALIDEAMGLVRPGGRIVYATCSLLTAENEDQIAAALARHENLSLMPYRQAWAAAAPATCPETASLRPDCLLMTPAQHGTDGFFVAILEKKSI